jgi:hypothetical protein
MVYHAHRFLLLLSIIIGKITLRSLRCRCYDGPLLVREIGRIDLASVIFSAHMRMLLCCGKMR